MCTIAESQVLGNLTYDIIYDIFIRLSIKEILRCKSVSKSWFSLITDPRFVGYHLDRAKRTNNRRHISFSGPAMMKTTSYQTLRSQKLYISLPRVADTEGVQTNDIVPQYIFFLSSCEGLVLVGRGQRDHFLWNPCTRSCKQIPKIPLDFGASYEHCIEDCIRMYGLGYDMSTDTYKIVRIAHILKPKLNRRLEFTARTYDCKKKSWKRICDFPYKIFRNAQGAVLNGAPHWIVAREDNENEYVIIYFDVVNDTIEEIDTPLPCSLGADFTFSNFEGSLCLVTTTERFSEIWVLRKDGSTERWDKLYRIDKDMNPARRYLCPVFWFNKYVINIVPLFYTKNEEILFQVRYRGGTEPVHPLKLITYDFLSKEQCKILTTRHMEANVFHSITYV